MAISSPILFAVAIAAIGVATCARAESESFLDYIRNTDLNDYALGVAVSANVNPYVTAADSAFAYPYLTSFQDSAFTDQWLLIREGNLGVRRVFDNDWELGVVARVQTLGLGNNNTPELAGLDDRQWGLELAPLIGYRGWPVHFDLRPYYEVLGRHRGFITHFSLTLPMQWSRGYFVPGIELVHLSNNYADYYYEVSPREATTFRPAYESDAASDIALKLRWGYALSEKWLLSGNVRLEFLDSAIKESPIVDPDRRLSFSVGLAYNADMFQRPHYDGSGTFRRRVEIRLGAFQDSIDSKVRRDSVDGRVGTLVDIEDLLGASDEATVLQLDGVFRIRTFHRLELSHMNVSRTGSATLSDALEFGEETIAAGTLVESFSETDITRISYGFSLVNDAQKELGVTAGLHFSHIQTEIVAPATGQRVSSNAHTPLPVIGAYGSVMLTQRVTVGARAQFFRLGFDQYEGSLNVLNVDVLWNFGETFSVGLAYNYYGMKVFSTESSFDGSLEVVHRGPMLFLQARF